MSLNYRLVHFAPDPLSGVRFPLGAVLAKRGGLEVVRSPLRPDAGCLGGKKHARLFAQLSVALEGVRSLDALPVEFGPQVTLGELRALPAGVDRPSEWIANFVLPQRPADGKERVGARGPRRAAFGYSFFKQQNVARWVRKTFDPKGDIEGWLGEEANGLDQVSHWVPGSREVLLMEPIVPRRDKVEEDLQHVAMLFMAYRYALEHARKTELEGRLVAFVLNGGDAALRAHIADKLHPIAHDVVDTRDDDQKKDFIARVERVGESGRTNELPF